jgi:hypothetical protein
MKDLYVDPAVSQEKFDRELARYRELEDDHVRRGWWMLKAQFPEVFVVFATQKVNPPCAVLGVLLDFTDYDFQPPSVRLVHPLTREPYKLFELPSQLKRTVPLPNHGQMAMEGAGGVAHQALMVAHHQEEIPFLCIPGVREYHNHPGHSGDLWALHRGTAEGTLFFLLSQIYKYGVEPINGFTLNLSVTVSGFKQSPPPN